MDPSLTGFGYGVLSPHKKPKLLEAGCIKTKPDPDLSFQFSDICRIGTIISKVKELILTYNIGFVCFEIPIGSKSNRASVALALVEGSLLGLFLSLGVEFHPYPPSVVKEALTGDRCAEKCELLVIVEREIAGFSGYVHGWSIDDIYAASDAVSVYLTHRKGLDPVYKTGAKRKPVKNKRKRVRGLKNRKGSVSP